MSTWKVAGAPIVALGLAVLAASCGGGDDSPESSPATEPSPPVRACTRIGCSSGVSVQLSRLPAEVESARVCVNGVCGRARVVNPPETITAELPRAFRRAGLTVRIAVELKDGRGETLRRLRGRAAVERSQPNGPDCPPVCFQAALRFGGRP